MALATPLGEDLRFQAMLSATVTVVRRQVYSAMHAKKPWKRDKAVGAHCKHTAGVAAPLWETTALFAFLTAAAQP